MDSLRQQKAKNSMKKQYHVFCNLLYVSHKDIPLSEIMDSIVKIVVDGCGQIVVNIEYPAIAVLHCKI